MCDEATVLVREVLMRSRSRIQGLLTAAAAALMLTMTGLVISATSAAAASGYWLGGDDGGVFSFNAPYNGNLLIGGEFSTDGNSVCAQGCSIGSGSSTDNYVLSSTADLNPDDFSDTVPEGLATLLFDGTGGAGGIPNQPNFPLLAFDACFALSPLARLLELPATKEACVILNANGMVSSAGNAPAFGSMDGKPFQGSMVGIASTPDGKGYWLVASDGGVFTFGDAQFWGSMGGQRLDQPVVGTASTPGGGGTGSSPLTAESSASVMPRMTDRWAGRTSMRRLSEWRLLWTARATGWLPLMEGSSRLGTHRLRDQWQAGRSAVRLPVLRPTDRCRNCCLRDRRQSLQRSDNNPGKS